jgi:dihydrofolate reductase
MRYFDTVSQHWVARNVRGASALLFGRRTYETFAAHWPTAGPDEQPLAGPLNNQPKYVASRTLTGPLGWHNARLLDGDAIDAVRDLAAHGSGELHLIGSAELTRTLIAAGLVDELRLMVDPVLLGGGKTLFPADGALRAWRLVENVPTSTGAMLATYAREAGPR